MPYRWRFTTLRTAVAEESATLFNRPSEGGPEAAIQEAAIQEAATQEAAIREAENPWAVLSQQVA